MAVDDRGRKLPRGIRYRNGKYEARFTYSGKAHSVWGKTIGEVQKPVTELKYKLETGTYIEKSKLTLNEWFDTWMETYKRNTIKHSTYQTYCTYYDKHIRDSDIGRMLISNIRAEHIQKLYNRLVDQEYSFSAINQIKTTIYGSLEQAVKNEMIERNPVKLVNLPKVDKKKARIAMTKEQQALFMEYAKDSYMYNLFALMLRTGLRVGEITGLKHTDVNRKQKVIHITRTMVYDHERGLYEDTPKTKTSIRDIPLTEDMLKLIDNQRVYWGVKKVESLERYIFTDYEGRPLPRSAVRNEIERLTNAIRRDGKEFPVISAHVFRHTFATRAIEHGMQPQILKTILGHSSLAMTMDLYSHVLPETRSEAMELIAGAF